MRILLSLLLAYLIGSLSTSTLITRWRTGTDIRDHGSGNAGATNTVRVLGLRWGLVVLGLDALKGVVAVVIAVTLAHGQPWAWYAAGLAVIAGHNWPIFFGFRGGKGIATTIGVYFVLLPVPVLLAGVIALLLISVTRYVSLGTLALVMVTPIFCAVMGRFSGVIVFTSFIAVLSVYRHRQNVIRLLHGKESRLFSRK